MTDSGSRLAVARARRRLRPRRPQEPWLASHACWSIYGSQDTNELGLSRCVRYCEVRRQVALSGGNGLGMSLPSLAQKPRPGRKSLRSPEHSTFYTVTLTVVHVRYSNA